MGFWAVQASRTNRAAAATMSACPKDCRIDRKPMNTLPASASGLLDGALARVRGASATYRLPVYIACTVLALATNYLLGKETAWDMLNYHLYAGFSAVNNRFGQDYFAAGPQSYFNPYAYVPFYALARAGLPALAIGSLLAAVHSIILWLTF